MSNSYLPHWCLLGAFLCLCAAAPEVREPVAQAATAATTTAKATITGEHPPEIKAFLDTIAYAEGTGDRYDILFGGGSFSDFSRHPDRCIRFRNTCSTAAGRYQFLNTTWASLNLPDMSPENQDKGAIKLLQQEGAYQSLVSGNFREAVKKARNQWASFPGAGYNQPEKSLSRLEQVYQQSLAKYK